jgi:8-oxo-dGTP pyrophosphatase MutT (NUDIX family)
MDFMNFVSQLDQRLQGDLPGRKAQLKMSSMVRLQEMMNLVQPDNAKRSSVLILLYPFMDEIGLVLMQRPEYGGVHGGQISLPGGKQEDDDESLVFTALREAQEELGIIPAEVQVLGQLTEMYIPPSNFLVTPVAGFVTHRPSFVADPKEVAGIIEIGLNELLDERNRKMKKMKIRYGFSLKVPCYEISGHVIWGATAMILSEFREVVLETIKGLK